MSVKVEKTENKNELKLEFTIAAEKFNTAIKSVFTKNAKYFNIPGFRKGKAPMQIVEKFYGKEIFYEDAFNEILQTEYYKELEENNIEAVSMPDIDVKEIGQGQDLVFTAIVQTKPEVELGKYKGIELPKVEYNVSADDIDHELSHMAKRNARMISVEDRAVENGDIAVIDFEGFVDGNPFEGGKAEKHELTVGSNTFIPGFEDQIIGMKVEEEKDVNVKFPDEYFSKDLAGKDAVFKVKLHEIKKEELPVIDDEFAKDVSEFDSLEELRNSIKDRLQKENESKQKYETEDAAIKAVCDNTQIEIPTGMIETEIDNMQKEVEQRMSYQGLTLEQYLEMTGKSKEDFRKEYEEQAKDSVKSKLILEAIIKAEKFEPTEEEIEEKIKEMADNYGKKPEELMENDNLKNYIKNSIQSQMAIDFIVANAKIK